MEALDEPENTTPDLPDSDWSTGRCDSHTDHRAIDDICAISKTRLVQTVGGGHIPGVKYNQPGDPFVRFRGPCMSMLTKCVNYSDRIRHSWAAHFIIYLK